MYGTIYDILLVNDPTELECFDEAGNVMAQMFVGSSELWELTARQHRSPYQSFIKLYLKLQLSSRKIYFCM